MNQLTQIPDLSFSLNKDGSIYLEQNASCGEVDRITMHSCHIRHLFECASHLLPPTPAVELAERLAVQLCELRDGLGNELGRSPGIDSLFFQATAACDMIPNSAYPNWLYSTDSVKVSDTKQSETSKPNRRPDFELTNPPKN